MDAPILIYFASGFVTKRDEHEICTRAKFRGQGHIDDFNREAPAIEVDTSLPAARVIRVLERLAGFRG